MPDSRFAPKSFWKIGKGTNVTTIASKSQKQNLSNTPPNVDPSFGLNAAVKTLYEGPKSYPPTYIWVNKPPKALPASTAREYNDVAIKVYKVKDREKDCIAGVLPLKFHRIDVQNPALVDALKPIIRNRIGSRMDSMQMLTFEEPFENLYFCQDDISELQATADAVTLKPYLELLIGVMDEALAEIRYEFKKMQQTGLVNLDCAWTLFPRTCPIYNVGVNTDMMCKIESSSYKLIQGEINLCVVAKMLTFDGEAFVWSEVDLAIPKFEGHKLITDLPFYPVKYHEHKDDVARRLIAQGKKVLDLQGLEYCSYRGIAMAEDGGNTGIRRHNVDCRILIDVFGYNKYHLSRGSREKKKSTSTTQQDNADRDIMGNNRPAAKVLEHGTSPDPMYTKQKPHDKKYRLSDATMLYNKTKMLENESDLAFMSGIIGGYALKNKIWMNFYVEDIEHVVWNDTAYDHLVYDAQQKDLVLSFVDNHGRAKALAERNGSFSGSVAGSDKTFVDDVIVGKGQGLIILLSGPPGTGKTLTAEAVADQTHRPLFHLQAEDLGITASSLGSNLKRVFEMATDWNAVILLDEADVFMTTRNPADIIRNELVSIFLRELEYYKGIIFLTTNLFETIDTAFRSRVSLHLLFPALSRDAREKVWKRFLDRVPKPALITDGQETGESQDAVAPEKVLDDVDVRELSLWELNGREIFNAVRMVRSWCSQKGYVMTLERMESGIKVTNPQAGKSGAEDDYGDLYE